MSTIALDWGGVLVTDGSMTAWRRLEEELAIPEAQSRRVWEALQIPVDLGEIGESQLWHELAALGDASEDAIRHVFLSGYVEIRHGVEALHVAAASGWQIVLATNNVMSWFAWWRERFAWFDLIDEICCSSALGVRKPDSRYYERLQATMRDPHGYFVDDKRENVVAARHAGLRGILADGDGQWPLPDELNELVT